MSNPGDAVILLVEGEMAVIACHLSSRSCGICGTDITTVPGMLLYRPKYNIYDMACRECSIITMRAAQVRLNDPEYNG